MVLFVVAWGVLFGVINGMYHHRLPKGISVMPVNVNEVYPSWLHYQMEPGDSLQDSFLVWNGYSFPVELTLGALDARDTATLEQFELTSEYDDAQEEIGHWVTVRHSSITLDRKTFTEVPFDLMLPDDVQEGEYWGAIFTDYSPDGQSGPIKTVIQTGLRVILVVSDEPQNVSIIGTQTGKTPFGSLMLPFYFSVIITGMAVGVLFLLHWRDRS